MFVVYFVSVTTRLVHGLLTGLTDGVFGDGWHLFGIGTSSYEDASGDYEKQTTAVDAFIEAAKDKGISTDNIEEVLGTKKQVKLIKQRQLTHLLLKPEYQTLLQKQKLKMKMEM